MRKKLGRKAAAVGATAIVILALASAAAIAAPVLKPGQTSAPGMSGTCTNCHTYAKPAKPAPLLPSHPYLAKKKQKRARTFKVWGYVPPKLSGASNATMTVYVQRSKAKGKWVAVSSLTTTATLSATGKFKNKTNYVAKLKISRVGKYRTRVKLVCLNADGVQVTKWSSLTTFKIVK
jgi:hypothetical protein